MINSSAKGLELLRKKIDDIDKEILKLLIKRFETVSILGIIKKRNKIPIIDKKRENKILNKALKFSNKYGKLLEKIYLEIIKSSRKVQR